MLRVSTTLGDQQTGVTVRDAPVDAPAAARHRGVAARGDPRGGEEA